MSIEVPRRNQHFEEHSYQNTLVDERDLDFVVAPQVAETPVRDVVEVAVPDEIVEQDQQLAKSAIFNLSERPSQLDSLLSPVVDHSSIVSYEAILSPFPSRKRKIQPH